MNSLLVFLALAAPLRASPQEATDLIVSYLEAFPTTMHPLAAQKAWGRLAGTECKDGPGGSAIYKPRTCVLEPARPGEVRRITLRMDEHGRILEELTFDLSASMFENYAPRELMARLPHKRGAVKKGDGKDMSYSAVTPFGYYGLTKKPRSEDYHLGRYSGLQFALEEPLLQFECAGRDAGEDPWARLECESFEQKLTLRFRADSPPAPTDAKAWYRKALELLERYLSVHPKAPAAWRDIRDILAEEKDRPLPHLPTWGQNVHQMVGFRYGSFNLAPGDSSEEGVVEVELTWHKPEPLPAD